jgi:hypothetical protein
MSLYLQHRIEEDCCGQDVTAAQAARLEEFGAIYACPDCSTPTREVYHSNTDGWRKVDRYLARASA